ncbi:MAG: acyl-CoA dehydrogenase family protein [Deltaproteobacteria bacterium]|nr:MAG: acyl-CoA dehydrogenase family protein [Deltaproteobacteria bacterium]
MNGNDKKIVGGAMFLLEDISFQEIFTPEDFTSEHKDIAKALEDFIKGEIISRDEEIETINNELSRELMRKAGELGFLGIDIPEKYGGMELDKISSAIVAERFGYGAGSFAVTEFNHTGIGTLPVALFGTEEQKEKYLPGLSSGKLVGAFGLTEPEAGSDALNPLTTATLTEDGKYYLLNGSKQFITNAGFADIVFTYAKVDGKLFTAFIVEQNWEGVSLDEEEEKMGMHGTSTRAYHFDNVKVPVENVLGEVGRGHVVALNALNMGRYKVGAACIGDAKAAFDEAVKYAKQRVQFGRPICEFGLIKEKISQMAIRLFASDSMMFRTAGLIQAKLEGLDMGSDDAGIRTAGALEEYLIECSINKIYGSETEDYVVDEEVQIFGGYGYIHGNHPELAYRNARINRIWEGTNEINRLVIVNTLMRRATKGTFDLMPTFQRLSEEIEKLEPVGSDEPNRLDAQMRLIQMAKKIILFVFGMAYEMHGKGLREEQELIGIMSDMIIEVYANESVLLRSQKMLNGKKPEKATISVIMTKVLFHDSLERIGFLATRALEAMEDGELLERHIKMIRRLMVSPPINTVTLRRDIADEMIRYGRYFF